MGIHDRDYYREEATSSWPGWLSGDYAVTRRLIAINVVVYVAQLLTQNDGVGGVTDWLVLTDEGLASFQLWRLVTYGFCHGSLWHILFNMYFLYIVGSHVEPVYRAREFFLIYMAGIVLSALVFVVMTAILANTGPAGEAVLRGRGYALLGASGAVSTVAMLWALHFPRSIIYLMGIVPLEARWAVLLWVALDLHPVLSGVSDGVAHTAHLGGFAWGFLYYRWGGRIARFLPGSAPGTGLWRGLKTEYKKRQRPEVKLFTPPVEPERSSESRLDQILAKINHQGEASLTAEERQFLHDESRRLREKR